MNQSKLAEAHCTQNSRECQKFSYVRKSTAALRDYEEVEHAQVKSSGRKLPGCDYGTADKGNLSCRALGDHTGNTDPDKLYACDQCDYKTQRKDRLREHAVRHRDEWPFLCDFPLCSYRAKKQSYLDRHKGLHDPDQDKLKKYHCSYCAYRSGMKANLEMHMRTHTGDKPYACDFPGCDYRATRQDGLGRHRRKHDLDSMLKCDFPGCDFKTTMRRNLKYHRERHNPERKRDLPCPLCPNTFARKECLKAHIKNIHTKERPLSCGHCDSTFTSAFNLRKHTAKAHASRAAGVDTILKKFKCTACDFRATTRTGVRQHQQRAHLNVNKRFECDKCKFRTKLKSYLEAHQNNRCPGLPQARLFACHLCEKKYSTNSSLQNHLKTIHRPKKLKCPKCEFVTDYPYGLRYHINKLHEVESRDSRIITMKGVGVPVRGGGQLTGARCSSRKVPLKDTEGWRKAKKRFKCEFPGCGFAASYQNEFRIHENRHRPEMKNIQCPMCPKKSYTRSELNTHVRDVHAKEKPFKCDECDYAGSSKQRIREHKRKVHKGNGDSKNGDSSVGGSEQENLVPAEQLGVTEFYSCPFCDWTHDEYMAIVRHTVIHRFPVVTLQVTKVSRQ